MSIRTENVNNFFSVVHAITVGTVIYILNILFIFMCCLLCSILIPIAIIFAAGPLAPIAAYFMVEIMLGLSPLIGDLLFPLIPVLGGVASAITPVLIGIPLLGIAIHILSLVIACTLDISEEIISRVRDSTFFSKPALEESLDFEVDSLSYSTITQILPNTSSRDKTRGLLNTNEQNMSINRPTAFFGSFSKVPPKPMHETGPSPGF